MAQKKFSRLSILLEARDKMTRPLQNASRASQDLQRKMRSLNGDQNRNAKGFDKVSNSVGQANSSVSRFSSSIIKFAKNSAVAYAANKVLSGSLNLVRLGAKNTAYALIDLGAAAINAFKRTKLYQGLEQVFNKVTLDIKNLTLNLLRVTKITAAWNASTKFLRTVRNNVRSFNDSIKQTVIRLNQATVSAVKNSRAYKLMERSINSVKRNAVAARLSFELWKNSSTFVQKMKNDFGAVGRAVSSVGAAVQKIIPRFTTLRNNINNMNRGLNKTNSRRATFNQLADSNAKLNRELAKMNSKLEKGNSNLSKMRSSLLDIKGLGAAFGIAYAAQAAYGQGKELVKGTIGTAMDQNYSQASVGILAGSKNAASYWKQIQDYASSTSYSAEDWAKNMRSAISHSSSVKDLEKFQLAMEQLATLDPAQGLDGAALAIRELNSGDITSLVERFELPRSAMKQIKGIKDPIKQIEALMDTVGKQTGYTVKNIQEMKKLPLMQWQKLTNSVKTMMGYIGQGALKKLAPMFEKLNKIWDSGALKPFINQMSTLFGDATGKVIDFVMKLSKTGIDISSLKEKFKPFVTLIKNVKDTVIEALPKIFTIGKNLKTILGNVADEVNAAWPTVNTILQKTLDFVVKISDWVANNWPAVISILGGAAAAFAAFKVVGIITTLWSGLTKVIALWRAGTLLATAAQWAMNTALLANPIGLVIAIIAGLVTAGILLYKNWDVVKAKADALWKKISEAWENMKTKTADVFSRIKASVINNIDYVIDKINGLIEKINKIPGVDVPIIPKIKETKEFTDAVAAGQNNGVDAVLGAAPGHHGGLNYVPYDGYTTRLHKGERVLTKDENKGYDKEKSGVLITGNQFIVRQDSDIDLIAEKLFNKLSGAQTAMG